MSRAAARVGDCGVYEDGRRRAGRIPMHEAAEIARTTDGFVWIGLQQATAEDIVELAAEFELPALAVEDAVKRHNRPKLQVYDDIVFVVLKPVRYIDSGEVVEVESISLFLGPGFVITVRQGETCILRQVRAELDAGSDLLRFGPTAVLYRAADLVADGYGESIDCINVDIDEIEEAVFGPGESDHAQRIYKLKQEVAEFRRAVAPLARPLERLADGSVPGIAKDAGSYFRDVHDHVLRSAETIDGLGVQLTDVLQANVARVTTGQSRIALRQNEDMRKISAWAAIALVPTAIAGIYGMNFEHMPELTWTYGYPMALALIAGLCISLFMLLRRRGWL